MVILPDPVGERRSKCGMMKIEREVHVDEANRDR